MGEPLLPIGGEQTAPRSDGVHVIRQRQRDDVRWQPVDDRSGLFAGAAVGLLYGDGVAGLFLPMPGEGSIEIGVQLARRIVGDVEEPDVFGGRGGHKAGQRQQGGSEVY